MLKLKPSLQVVGGGTQAPPPPPKRSWQDAEVEYGESVDKTLKETFKHTGFRNAIQKQAVYTVLGGNDCLVIMPTGSGKSLTYQLPALILPGVAIVVSPLVALMQNQVAALRAKGISANLLSASQQAGEKKAVQMDLHLMKPTTKLLYMTPEMITETNFIEKYLLSLNNRHLLSLFVIDESHCISQWGHDFRPAFCKLAALKRHFKHVPVLACTATATLNVQKDILSSLEISQAKKFLSGFNRPNISYEVRYKAILQPDANTGLPLDDMAEAIRSFGPDAAGIIYCWKREECDMLARVWATTFKIAAYHAGLAHNVRTETLQNWMKGTTNIVVATIAFGMGIDHANVRFVIHNTLPKSIEDFYQESGRAGRDQKPSKSILYYSVEDSKQRMFMLNKDAQKDKEKGGKNPGQTEARAKAFEMMVKYCGEGCRRSQLLNYFGQPLTADEKVLSSPCCDWCTNRKLVKLQFEKQHAMGNSTLLTDTTISGFSSGKVRSLGKGSGYVKMPGKITDEDNEVDYDESSPSPGFKSVGALYRQNSGQSAQLDTAGNDDEMLAIAAAMEKAAERKKSKPNKPAADFRAELRAESGISSYKSKSPTKSAKLSSVAKVTAAPAVALIPARFGDPPRTQTSSVLQPTQCKTAAQLKAQVSHTATATPTLHPTQFRTAAPIPSEFRTASQIKAEKDAEKPKAEAKATGRKTPTPRVNAVLGLRSSAPPLAQTTISFANATSKLTQSQNLAPNAIMDTTPIVVDPIEMDDPDPVVDLTADQQVSKKRKSIEEMPRTNLGSKPSGWKASDVASSFAKRAKLYESLDDH